MSFFLVGVTRLEKSSHLPKCRLLLNLFVIVDTKWTHNQPSFSAIAIIRINSLRLWASGMSSAISLNFCAISLAPEYASMYLPMESLLAFLPLPLLD